MSKHTQIHIPNERICFNSFYVKLAKFIIKTFSYNTTISYFFINAFGCYTIFWTDANQKVNTGYKYLTRMWYNN